MKNLIARAEVTIDAPVAEVWEGLVNPDLIRRYMFGTIVEAEWREGGRIVWRGEWLGRKYEDRGRILAVSPGRFLKYSHYSPLSGLPDAPENYHIVTVGLVPRGNGTLVTLSQDNNPDDESRRHSEQNWNMVLDGLKKIAESGMLRSKKPA